MPTSRDVAPIASSRQIEHLRRLSYWLDEGIRIPGTRVRFGLDPIIGLIPGVGDAAGAIMAAAILLEAIRRGVPRSALVRIAANIAIDTAVGAFPVLGDLFDAAWKANKRNLAILERHVAEPSRQVGGNHTFLYVVGGLALAVVGALVVGGAYLTVRLLQFLATR